jgi:hypothetical protein
MMPKWSGLCFTLSLLLVIPLAGCAQSTGPCLEKSYVDLSEINNFANNAQLPFQFPLDEVKSETTSSFTHFCASSSGPASKREYHAAEDYFHPAGTSVYAIADGKISFSGPMGGYGWLIIIDHPQVNIYSLYGHLSPSRWRLESGSVKKGDLIAYLGDADENGGTSKHPLEPHLHLGIRSGQRSDYPGKGEWRWQAGWIKPCPTGVGWLQPSIIIASQDIPSAGFPAPEGNLFSKWGIELLFGGFYFIGGISMLIYATKRNKPFLIFFSGVVLLAASWFFFRDGWRMVYVIFPFALVLFAIGIYRLVSMKKDR